MLPTSKYIQEKKPESANCGNKHTEATVRDRMEDRGRSSRTSRLKAPPIKRTTGKAKNDVGRSDLANTSKAAARAGEKLVSSSRRAPGIIW